MQLKDFLLHCNQYIGQFIQEYGNFIYPILFIIIFCETGLVFLPFLPGDSLIFAAGTFAAIGKMNFWLLIIIIIMSAILGDTVNYEIGKHFGKKILNNKKFKLIKDENLKKAEDLVKQYGGKLTAKWVYGMVVYNGKEAKEYTWSKKHFYFIDKPSEKRNPGYPLDSISIMPECNKYFVELTDEDKKQNKENYNDDDVIEFIVNSL